MIPSTSSCAIVAHQPRHPVLAMPTRRREPSRRTLYFVVSAVFHYLGPGVRGAAVRARRRARRRVAADRLRGRGLRAVAAAVARVRRARPRRPPPAARLGRRARGDELLLLPGDRPAAARHRRGDRVPAGDRARRARRAHAAQRWPRSRSPCPACTCSPTCGWRASRSGVAFAFANAVLFAAYIVLAHRVAQRGGDRRASTGWRRRCWSRVVVVTPLGGWAAVPAFGDPVALLAGIGVGISLVGDPVRLRPARDAPAAAGDLRADGLAAAGDRDGRRHRRRSRRSRAPSRWSGSRSSSRESPSTVSRRPRKIRKPELALATSD